MTRWANSRVSTGFWFGIVAKNKHVMDPDEIWLMLVLCRTAQLANEITVRRTELKLLKAEARTWTEKHRSGQVSQSLYHQKLEKVRSEAQAMLEVLEQGKAEMRQLQCTVESLSKTTT